MGATASGFWFPDTSYTSGVRQAFEDAADAAEAVIVAERATLAKARGRLKGIPAATVNLVGSTITPLTTGLATDYEEGVTAGSGTLTIVKAGRYRLKAGYVVLPNATGQRNVYITKNNTTGLADVLAFGMDDGSAAGFASPTAEGVATLAAGDIIRLLYYQNSSGTLGLRTLADTVAGIYLEVEEI